jgi:hypothetical protein
MPNFTEWGPLGAVVFLVVVMLSFMRWWMLENQRAQDKRDLQMTSFFERMYSNITQDTEDMRQVSERITTTLDKIVMLYNAHDTRAISIQQAIETLKTEIAKLTRVRGKSQ